MEKYYTVTALFALTALLGMYLLAMVLREKETPKSVTLAHGLFAVIALVLLVVKIAGDGSGPVESAVLFAMAAAGGFVLVFRDLTGKKIPKWLAVAHGLLAISGFVFLLISVFCQN
jgi:hypothetical protein